MPLQTNFAVILRAMFWDSGVPTALLVFNSHMLLDLPAFSTVERFLNTRPSGCPRSEKPHRGAPSTIRLRAPCTPRDVLRTLDWLRTSTLEFYFLALVLLWARYEADCPEAEVWWKRRLPPPLRQLLSFILHVLPSQYIWGCTEGQK